MFRSVLKTVMQLSVVVALGLSGAVYAQDKGSADEAMAMAKRAVAALKVDKDKGIAAINDPNNKDYHDRDLYVFAGPKAGGAIVAHGVNAGLIGRDLEGLKDVDGKLFLAEVRKLANDKGSGWVDYKWTNPVTKKIELKSTYVEAAGDLYVGVGIYK